MQHIQIIYHSKHMVFQRGHSLKIVRLWWSSLLWILKNRHFGLDKIMQWIFCSFVLYERPPKASIRSFKYPTQNLHKIANKNFSFCNVETWKQKKKFRSVKSKIIKNFMMQNVFLFWNSLSNIWELFLLYKKSNSRVEF